MTQVNGKLDTAGQDDVQMGAARERMGALADGALDAAEAERSIELLLARPDLRAAWADVHMVGDALRSEETGPDSVSTLFIERFSATLALEPTILAPSSVAGAGRERWRRFGLPAISVAAAVAMVSWVAWPQRPVATIAASAPEAPAPAPLRVVAPTLAVAPSTARPVDAAQLREYLAAHQQYSSPQLNGLGSYHTAAWSTGSSDNSNP